MNPNQHIRKAKFIDDLIGGRQLILFSKFIFIMLFGIMFISTVKAQSTNGWNAVIDTASVKISYQVQSCSGQDYIFLKVENNSADSIAVSWDDNFSSGTASFSSAGSSSYNRTLHLGSNQSLQMSCSALINSERPLTLPLGLFLSGGYTSSTVTYSVSNFSKNIY